MLVKTFKFNYLQIKIYFETREYFVFFLKWKKLVLWKMTSRLYATHLLFAMNGNTRIRPKNLDTRGSWYWRVTMITYDSGELQFVLLSNNPKHELYHNVNNFVLQEKKIASISSAFKDYGKQKMKIKHFQPFAYQMLFITYNSDNRLQHEWRWTERGFHLNIQQFISLYEFKFLVLIISAWPSYNRINIWMRKCVCNAHKNTSNHIRMRKKQWFLIYITLYWPTNL